MLRHSAISYACILLICGFNLSRSVQYTIRVLSLSELCLYGSIFCFIIVAAPLHALLIVPDKPFPAVDESAAVLKQLQANRISAAVILACVILLFTWLVLAFL